ncbi:hypothetical protein HRJ34_17925 [Rhizorhabdus wittichii]|uniref:Uncharacterized protein n=1 Tax=Rhizorhabdus wittichii TaxID=160791 RepID=A0A975HDY3_9SPHN|nr:hypothetical protein HRJ34_17925 [Rhizorhabdus wittichii]
MRASAMSFTASKPMAPSCTACVTASVTTASGRASRWSLSRRRSSRASISWLTSEAAVVKATVKPFSANTFAASRRL